MPATTENNNQGSFLGRISIRRNQVMSMDGSHDQEMEDLELFQKHIGDRFSELLSSTSEDSSSSSSSSSGDALLSIAWLLDELLCCEAEFKALVLMGHDPSQIGKPPLDKILSELLDTVKNLQRLVENASQRRPGPPHQKHHHHH